MTDAPAGVVKRSSPDAATDAAASPKFTARSRPGRRRVKTRVASSASADRSPKVGGRQLGERVPQRGQPPVDVQEDGVPAARRAPTSRAGSARRSRVLRVGDDGRVPAHPRELRDPPLGGRLPEVGLGVRGEELERRRRRPLLAHEEHRRERAAQGQQRRARQLVVVEVLGQPVAASAVADLVVVLAAHDEPPGSASARCRSAARAPTPRNDDQVPSWKNPRSQTFTSADSGAKSA